MLQRRGEMMLLLAVALLAPSLCSPQSTSCVPPSITVGPPQYFLGIESPSNIPLPCQASGTNHTIRWEFNGTSLTCSSSGIACVDGVPTYISYAGSSNEGFYRCFVTGACGSTMSTLSQLQLESHVPSSTLILTPQYSVNTPFSLPYNSTPSTPSITDRANRSPSSPYGDIPRINWYTVTDLADQNPQLVQTSSRIQINSITGDLYFATPLFTDTNLYKCGTMLTGSETNGGFSQLTLYGTESNFATAPLFTTIVPPRGLEGESVEMQCFFSGRPTPLMQASSWTRSGGVSLPQGRTLYSNDFTKLIIATVQPDDAGDYICAPSGMPTLTQTINLVVDAAPVFKSVTDGPHDINATEGDTVTVHCNAYARPPATVQWYKDTMTFDYMNLPYKFSLNYDSTILTITNVCKGSWSCGGGVDLMALQCEASNKHGKAYAQGSLNVLDASSPPPENAATTQQETTGTTSRLRTTPWQTTQQETTATSRLLTTLMRTTTGKPEGGGPGGDGPGGCGSGSLAVKLEGKDVKLELDLRINPPKDEGRSSGELHETFRDVFHETEQKTRINV